MNRQSRVLPFPQSRGKDKPPSQGSTAGGKTSNGGTASTADSTAPGSSSTSKSMASSLGIPKGVVNASSIPKGVVKSGIKSAKGLVNNLNLNVSAKLNLSSKERQDAPSVSATVATAESSSAPPHNGRVNNVGIHSNTNGSHLGFKRKTSSVYPSENVTPKTNNDDEESLGRTPITDLRNLEEFVQCESSFDSGPDPRDASPERCKAPEESTEDRVGEEDATSTAASASCSCTDDENGELCPFCKELNKQPNVGMFLTVVSKNKVHKSVREDFKLRLLCPDDVPEVKALCGDWFPVEYPDSWYTDITSNKRFHSLAAIINDQIVGLLISEVKARARLHREDSTILSSAFPAVTQVAYILSLGVVSTFRRLGIATALLTNLLNYLNTHNKLKVKAVYLHVLASNTNAISFYEKHYFRRHEYLPYYYAIRGNGKDGLSYVLYINGGQPPWTLLDYMKLVGAYITRMQPSSLPSAMASRTRNFLSSRRSWLPSLPSMPSMPNVNLPSMPSMPNVNLLHRLRGQAPPGSSHDPEVGLTPEEIAAIQAGEDETRNRSWLPSVNYYSLLQRFGGQCYDSGEQPDFEDVGTHQTEESV